MCVCVVSPFPFSTLVSLVIAQLSFLTQAPLCTSPAFFPASSSFVALINNPSKSTERKELVAPIKQKDIQGFTLTSASTLGYSRGSGEPSGCGIANGSPPWHLQGRAGCGNKWVNTGNRVVRCAGSAEAGWGAGVTIFKWVEKNWPVFPVY